MSEPVLSLSGITKAYRDGKKPPVSVLRGVNFTLEAGEIVALVAPSGAGKSTLLHIAGLLDTPDAGEILLAGKKMQGRGERRRTQARRSEIGFVYQFHHLLGEFTALENVALPQRANGFSAHEAANRARDLLARVGLADRAKHRPAEMSGGEQQRVAFCRALANAPSLLLADEPTGNLDSETAQQVFDVLTSLVRETGLSALIATHNTALAEKMDRIVHLDGGLIDSVGVDHTLARD